MRDAIATKDATLIKLLLIQSYKARQHPDALAIKRPRPYGAAGDAAAAAPAARTLRILSSALETHHTRNQNSLFSECVLIFATHRKKDARVAATLLVQEAVARPDLFHAPTVLCLWRTDHGFDTGHVIGPSKTPFLVKLLADRDTSSTNLFDRFHAVQTMLTLDSSLINVCDAHGMSPLAQACAVGRPPSWIAHLLDAGARVDACATHAVPQYKELCAGVTPLMLACMHFGGVRKSLEGQPMAGEVGIVQQLLSRGADPCARNANGHTAAELYMWRWKETHYGSSSFWQASSSGPHFNTPEANATIADALNEVFFDNSLLTDAQVVQVYDAAMAWFAHCKLRRVKQEVERTLRGSRVQAARRKRMREEIDDDARVWSTPGNIAEHLRGVPLTVQAANAPAPAAAPARESESVLD